MRASENNKLWMAHNCSRQKDIACAAIFYYHLNGKAAQGLYIYVTATRKTLQDAQFQLN